MQNELNSHKYWFLAGAVFIIALFFLYPATTYDDLKMEVDREEAIEIAQKFLSRQHVDLDQFYKEGFLDRNMGSNAYLQRNLESNRFAQLMREDDWFTYGWNIVFHKNVPQNDLQTRYIVIVSHKGSIKSYIREIPDSADIPSLSREEATKLITEFIKSNTHINLNEFELAVSKENNLSKRTDYSFKWEKDFKETKGKLTVTASVQGDQPGAFAYQFEAPEGNEFGVETTEALFSTISAIFIFFMTQFAIYVFLKKYHQGEVWVKMGRNLFIIYFVISIINLINSWPGIGRSVSIGDLNFFTVKIIVMLVNGLLLYFLIGLFVFSSWAVGESHARSLWPNKLRGMDAFVKGHITSLQSGASLMIGMIIGTGIFVIHLLITCLFNSYTGGAFVNIVAHLEPYNKFIPVLDIFTDAFTTSMLFSVAIIFFTVNLSYQKWKKKWLSIFIAGVISTLGNAVIYSSISVNIFALDMLILFATGCLIAYLYFAFDLLTIFSISFNIYLLKTGFILLAGATTFYEINLMLLAAVYLFTPIIYFISRIRKEEFVLENFGAPSHIQKISERERMKKELEIAAKVQLSLLPKEQLKLIGYDIAAISIPAIEAGGDYYDFVNLGGNKVGIAIGDVSGKGVGAAIYMTLTKGILQAHAEENVSPKVVLGKVNRLLYKTIEKNSFVSMFYAILDTENHEIVYSRAGHNPGILCSLVDGSTRLLMGKGMALGLEEGAIFTNTLFEDTFKVNSGDVVVLYTDGFTEAMNERLEQYGEKRLTELIQNNRTKKSSELVDLILKDARKHMDNFPQHDDMTIVIVKRI